MPNKRSKIAAIDVVAIGSSTGGPPLLEEIFKELPKDFTAAVLVVQHMPKTFTESFPRRLSKEMNIPIKEAEDGDIVEAGAVLLAPGDSYMVVKEIEGEHGIQKVIELGKKSENGPLDTIDTMLWSVAKAYKYHSVGIILSGMGEDGRLGMQEIKKQGGYTIVQDPDTAVIGSMPQAVLDDGMADSVMQTKYLPSHLIKLFT